MKVGDAVFYAANNGKILFFSPLLPGSNVSHFDAKFVVVAIRLVWVDAVL